MQSSTAVVALFKDYLDEQGIAAGGAVGIAGVGGPYSIVKVTAEGLHLNEGVVPFSSIKFILLAGGGGINVYLW